MSEPQVLHAKVLHKRNAPTKNQFHYHVYYLVLPLDWIEDTKRADSGIAVGRRGLHAFYPTDHGYRDERPLRQWVEDILLSYQQPLWQDITLVCMPRVLGYVFNPVSFWICRDAQQRTRAVICEVNNTFGETHTYLALAENAEEITANTIIRAEKCFHVSPFLPRTGSYRFQFALQPPNYDFRIDYLDAQEHPVLITKLWGATQPSTRKVLLVSFFKYPWVTLKAILLIHYQALKLVVKKIPFIQKPKQLPEQHSRSKDRH